ncbi:hypothetical protein, partial [Mariprofundus sp. EBB-1]|uniref:hypothetical protein n=1 Tax=Mariprofundus sp. EBB-1 TaxID=2650971 RepID=UPI001F280CCC
WKSPYSSSDRYKLSEHTKTTLSWAFCLVEMNINPRAAFSHTLGRTQPVAVLQLGVLPMTLNDEKRVKHTLRLMRLSYNWQGTTCVFSNNRQCAPPPDRGIILLSSYRPITDDRRFGKIIQHPAQSVIYYTCINMVGCDGQKN